MADQRTFNRRAFIGGSATALGYLTLKPSDLIAGTPTAEERVELAKFLGFAPEDDYDKLAKISFNENPYGPPESVLKAMTMAFKYANRYGYPDGGIVEAIAKHHGVKPENVVLGAGSGELLDVMGSAFAQNGKKVVGASPSYEFVYS